MRSPLNVLADVWIGLATALAILAVTIPFFLNPAWVGFEQGRAQATAWTGFSEADLTTATNAILSDLIVGPPDFDVSVDGASVLNDRERSHMRDVRGVFMGFFALAIVASVSALVIAARRRGEERALTWRAVQGGALGLIASLIVGGVIAFFAFDALFETFHRIFFSSGSYAFDPTTDRLVQLFPFQFWNETAIAVGVVSIVIALVVALLVARRLDRAADDAPVAGSLERSRP
ncbi:MAG: TIGR01906 family membrane protein [Chloroflexota bacterium]